MDNELPALVKKLEEILSRRVANAVYVSLLFRVPHAV